VITYDAKVMGPVRGKNLADLLQKIEKRTVVAVMKSQRGNISRSAEVIGISRQGLYNKLKTLEIPAVTGRGRIQK